MPADPTGTAVAPGDHVVRVYDRDEELVDAAGSYLLDAVRAGGVAVIVSTADHRAVLEDYMVQAGVDVAAGLARGTIVSLDARRAMDGFLGDEGVDAPRFDAVLGSVIRRALDIGSPVHLYADMVDLLWEEGRLNEVVELESLGAALAEQLPVSLQCGYRSSLVGSDDTADTFRHVCGLHTAVVGGRTASVRSGPVAPAEHQRTFEPDFGAPKEARRYVRRLLEHWACDEELVADGALLVTELATNAVIHCGSAFTLAVTFEPDGVAVSVADACPPPPKRQEHSPLALSGRGLVLVDALAKRWGTERAGEGKRVWAVLAP